MMSRPRSLRLASPRLAEQSSISTVCPRERASQQVLLYSLSKYCSMLRPALLVLVAPLALQVHGFAPASLQSRRRRAVLSSVRTTAPQSEAPPSEHVPLTHTALEPAAMAQAARDTRDSWSTRRTVSFIYTPCYERTASERVVADCPECCASVASLKHFSTSRDRTHTGSLLRFGSSATSQRD